MKIPGTIRTAARTETLPGIRAWPLLLTHPQHHRLPEAAGCHRSARPRMVLDNLAGVREGWRVTLHHNLAQPRHEPMQETLTEHGNRTPAPFSGAAAHANRLHHTSSSPPLGRGRSWDSPRPADGYVVQPWRFLLDVRGTGA